MSCALSVAGKRRLCACAWHAIRYNCAEQYADLRTSHNQEESHCNALAQRAYMWFMYKSFLKLHLNTMRCCFPHWCMTFSARERDIRNLFDAGIIKPEDQNMSHWCSQRLPHNSSNYSQRLAVLVPSPTSFTTGIHCHHCNLMSCHRWIEVTIKGARLRKP